MKAAVPERELAAVAGEEVQPDAGQAQREERQQDRVEQIAGADRGTTP